MGRYSNDELQSKADEVKLNGFCVLTSHFSRTTLGQWHEAFLPLLQRQITLEGHATSRGPGRFYVTLPFADPALYEDDDILGIVSRLLGADLVLCQLASDTPTLGSDYQDIHRDTPPLFPEAGMETPAYQLAVHFPLVDVGRDNGPLEIVSRSHMMSRGEGLQRLANGELHIQAVAMQLGDVMIRDGRALHRGTPNQTAEPRPMVVIGYSRAWLHRPEVHIEIPAKAEATLSPRARAMLRFNPVVEELRQAPKLETYQSFAY